MDLVSLTQPLRDRRWFGYAFGLFTLLIAYGVRISLGDAALRFPFVIFIPPVVLTTFLGGWRPGVAAATLAGVIANLTLIAPPGSILPTWPDGWIAMGFYVLTVGVDIALIHAMTTAFARAAAAERDLRRLNEELEQRVADRTEALQRQVAERDLAQSQLQRMQKMETIGQLSGGIAHDFNNMLAVVIGSLDMARRRKNDSARLLAYIESADEAAKRAAQLTARLLAFSRQRPLAPQVLDANRLLTDMSEFLQRTLGEAVRVETALSSGLWGAFADRAGVESAILNLAVNARDAMPDGGLLTIETANADLDDQYARTHAEVEPGQYALISITDTGVGMPPEIVERAFEPFFTTKGVGKGTGLGLSQVYGFVKQSGGHVSIYSEVGRGTTVKIYLPRYVGAEDALPSPPADSATPPAVGDEIILVVEDETGVRQMSVDALRDLGYTVMEAADARQAITQLAVQPRVDLLFTDIVMPEMNGRQLADKARELRPNLKVVFTTGYTRNALVHHGALDPGVSLLPKPFTVSELATTIRDTLDDRGSSRSAVAPTG
jgi:signal transduction histidine kinase/ActR/RegA family two-component response regulator